jgi:adenosylcobinamide-GDP ribazoletransferase
MFKELALAFGFLTVLPTPQVSHNIHDLGRAGKWFPLVGLVLGVLLACVEYCGLEVFPIPLAAALTIVAWVFLTGGLHLDGLADCFDGLTASVSVERRLEIMRDPRMGAFGGIGLSLFLILKVFAVASILAVASAQNWIFALLFAPVAGRFTMLLAARQKPARPGGLGDTFARELGIGSLFVAAIVPFALMPVGTFLLGAGPIKPAAAFCAALFATLIVSLYARARLGGMTGDVLGLVAEISELAVLLVFASRL